ncbi:hypothetical protein G7Z17_g1021 [Cylindrodendrum hubeiense]|uniref:mitogen-activated protein kinase kinase n=1 Tax=Cylindrodendrum hubeiense TaxID=595255 RepID=A0A9P5HGS7_9HYPO|nr:hypothetical protein G7Z17_g1021 [Cylindrodendrum hubeiense]
MDELPELVRDWKLNVIVRDSYTLQTRHVSNPETGRWRTRVEEKWQRTKKLGQGGFGVVWLEQCTEGLSAGQVRAVKQIQTGLGNQTVRTKMISSELSAIVKFSQKLYRDCFVRSFGWYDSPESIFITMEYLSLGDLEEHIAFMHQSKFAHRDLKPRNLLVQHKGPDWWVKISDFGISKQIGSTVLRTAIGTEHYQAPEVKGIYRLSEVDDDDDDLTYDLAVDIWAVGAITFRVATGQVPFPGKRDLSRYVIRDASFPTDDSLSATCAKFITKTMSPSARDRPTAEEALKNLWINEQTSVLHGASPGPDPAPEVPSIASEDFQQATARWTTSSNLAATIDNTPTTPNRSTSRSRYDDTTLRGNLDRKLHDGPVFAPAPTLSDTMNRQAIDSDGINSADESLVPCPP